MINSKLITRAELPSWLNSVRRLDDGSVVINGLRINPDGFPIGIPVTIVQNFDIANSSGSSATDLHSTGIVQGILENEGDYVDFQSAGTFANNDNDKSVRLVVGGNTVINPNLTDIDGIQGWEIKFRIYRLTATTVRVAGTLTINQGSISSGGTTQLNGSSWLSYTTLFDATVSNLDSNDLLVVVTGQGSANNDVSQYLTNVQAIKVA